MALLFMFRIVFYFGLLATVLGHPGYQDMIPNGRNVPSWAGVGHLMPEGGGPRNQFGLDFLAAGLNWTKALCELDSDGDGMTNGQELGDPQCVWQQGQTPARTTGITHPGLPDNPNSPGFCTPVNSYADSFTVDLKVSNLIIPNNTANYACQTFNLTTDLWPSGVTETNSYIVKFEPIIDNVAMVQHILLQECITYAAVNGACPQSGATLCDRIAYAWGPTDKEFCLPHFIGMPVNPSKFYMLKIFYNNPSQTSGLVDNSGIRVTVTANQTVQIPAGVLMTGRIESRRLILPAGQANITTSGVCPASCTQLIIPDANGINVFGSFLFMHSLGRRIWTQRSDNTTSVAEFLGDDLDFVTTNYTFTPNAPFDKIKPNDKIFTACEYDTTSVTSAVVEGEVCFSFLMHYPRLGIADNACGSFTADTYRDNRETAFCGSASLWDVANNNRLPLADCYPITKVAAPMAYALDVILPECRVNGVDQCNDNCTAMLSEWIAGACIEDWGISFMFDFTCTNSTCDEFQALLTHNCYGICAYNMESVHCPVPSGNITSYKCVNHQCVAVYVTPPTPTDPVAAPTDPTPTTTPTDLAPSNSVRFNQRYGPAYYAMMSVVVAVGVAIAGFAVGFFVWKTVQNRELNYNANINPN